jgi:hypothetical protein
MRDLSSRLRDIVKRDAELRAPARELTYVPDAPQAMDPDRVAEALGGTRLVRGSSACITIDRVWEPSDWHGRRQVSAYTLDSHAPLALLDPRHAENADWARRVVFFDLETTGLSGGAGTLAFLAGCGWFDDEGFRVRQFFLTGPAGEPAMLDGLAEIFDDTSLLVTFNGRSFDVPLMDTRWAFHRRESATDDLPHFDMLPPARRLWRNREEMSLGEPLDRLGARADGEFARGACSLGTLERTVLGFHRLGDVGGFEIPVRYFHFLRTADVSAIEGVLTHNQYDLLSLAALMSHALWLAREGPAACREPAEQLALGRLYDRAGDVDRARAAFTMAAQTTTASRGVRREALACLAVRLRRDADYDAAAGAWRGVLDLSESTHGELSPLDRIAAEALAVHHEHRARDLESARRYAEALGSHARGRRAEDVGKRLSRIERKLKKLDGGLFGN